MKKILVASVAFAVLTIGPALAADLAPDMPIKAPRGAAVASSNGFYLWADGSWQDIHLPAMSIGYISGPFGNPVNGQTDVVGARASGYGITGGTGYMFEHGTFSPLFGSNVRVEIGGSYVKADGTQFAGNNPLAAGPIAQLQLLNGSIPAGITTRACNSVITCATSDSLSTNYQTWQINTKIASDYRVGGVVVTPSLALFGGDGRNHQNFSQLLNQFVSGTLNDTTTYNASTALDWTEFGGRFGLDTTINLNERVAFGLGGFAGLADRRVSLSGSDNGSSPGFGGGPIGAFSGASTILATTSTTAFIANAEASLTFKATQMMSVNIFAGLNYDDRVPGVSSPTFTATATTPAGIKFQAETSYYAGGGVKIRF